MDKRVFFLCKYITENLQQEFLVERLAKKIKLSPSHFRILFKKEIGLSPSRYIINLRLEEARKLLETEDFLSVKQILLRVGFNEQSHFTREFKIKYGVTPKEHRNQKWAEEESKLKTSHLFKIKINESSF